MESKISVRYRVNIMRMCIYIFIVVYVVGSLNSSVTGFADLITGGIFATKMENENYFPNPTIPALCSTLITSGELVLLTAPLGMYGTKKQSSVVLTIFAVCVTTMILIEVSAAVVGIAAYQGDSLIHRMDNALKMDYKSEDHRLIWDDLQQNLRCCGTFGYWSWTGRRPPLSCCHNNESERFIAPACAKNKAGRYVFEKGCTPILRDTENSFFAKLFGIAIVTSFLKVVEFFTLFAAVIQMIIHDNNPNLLYDGILMAIVAVIVISLSFFGIFGSVRENYLNLFVFAGILGTVLLISLMIHLLLLPSKNAEVEEEDMSEKRKSVQMIDDSSFGNPSLDLVSYWKEKKRSVHRMHEEYSQNNEASNLKVHTFSMEMWDTIHQMVIELNFRSLLTAQFRCCGPSGPVSWTESNLSIPPSCCHVKDSSADPVNENCSRSNKGPYMYTDGCALFEHAFLSSKEESSSEITLAVLMRAIGYLLQFATVVLAAWLAILILMSRRQEYDFHPKKEPKIIDY